MSSERLSFRNVLESLRRPVLSLGSSAASNTVIAPGEVHNLVSPPDEVWSRVGVPGWEILEPSTPHEVYMQPLPAGAVVTAHGLQTSPALRAVEDPRAWSRASGANGLGG